MRLKLRFGFVAMSLHLGKASPSQTMTLKYFLKIKDREAALRGITSIARSNLTNTLRILRYSYISGVYLYRFTSKLIPLYGHKLTKDWDIISFLKKDLKAIGDYVLNNGLRVSFHPDHYTVINSPDPQVVTRSIEDLKRHINILEAMGLDEKSKLVIHIGGGYKDKAAAKKRFIRNWLKLPENIRKRVTLENDDKIFTAAETLEMCMQLGIPMVLDIHHHWCNKGAGELTNLVELFFQTWGNSGLPPKIHVSSPKSEKDFRSHADHVNPRDVMSFLQLVKNEQDLDIMVEAKKKDEAMFKLVQELAAYPGFKQESGGVLIFSPSTTLQTLL